MLVLPWIRESTPNYSLFPTGKYSLPCNDLFSHVFLGMLCSGKLGGLCLLLLPHSAAGRRYSIGFAEAGFLTSRKMNRNPSQFLLVPSNLFIANAVHCPPGVRSLTLSVWKFLSPGVPESSWLAGWSDSRQSSGRVLPSSFTSRTPSSVWPSEFSGRSFQNQYLRSLFALAPATDAGSGKRG